MTTAARIGPTFRSLLVVTAVALSACGSPSETTTAGPTASGALSVQSSPTASPPTPTPDATPIPLKAPADLDFEVSLFGRKAGQSRVTAMTAQRDQLVAVGVEYEHHLPLFGPEVPHEGRVWLSADGREWHDVTPRGVFNNVFLQTLIRRADDSLIVFGWTSSVNAYGELQMDGVSAWESIDGRVWTATSSGLSSDR